MDGRRIQQEVRKMTGEITRKSVLLECLSYKRQELAEVSKNHDGHEPARGKEEAWARARRKVYILQELIHSYDNPQVRAAIADWQKDVMENGPEKVLKLDGGNEPEMRFYEG